METANGTASAWGARIATARLASGLVLFCYVATHYLNHALGLWSLELLDLGRGLFLAAWRNPVGTVALYAAVAVHVAIALRAIYLRDAIRGMSWTEIFQLFLGIGIPLIVIEHVIATRYMDEVHGVEDDYIYVLMSLWVWAPEKAALQAVGLAVAWIHGCIGLHLWLQFKPWYPRLWPYLLILAVLVPTLAMAGYVAAGMGVDRLAADPDWARAAIAGMNLPPRADIGRTLDLIDMVWRGFAGLVVLAFVARAIRRLHERRTLGVTLRYGTGRSVRATRGATILETSRQFGIPHASVCGGRGRCSTCRVRIGRGLQWLPAPSDAEAKVLTRISAPPNVRLGCQTRVVDGLEVTPLLPPHASAADSRSGPGYLQGREMEIAVLFADIRGFTTISEERLPYDVVFILNRYFAEMGPAIEAAGGRIDKFIGDGIMALFGVDSTPEQGARAALEAARGMGSRLVDLNASLADDIPAPLRIGIGLHLGPAIVGEMGYGRVRGLTAVGDTVNTASRLESMTKEHGAQLIVSQHLAEAAGADLGDAPTVEIDIRGREGRIAVRVVEDVSGLTPR